MSEIKTLVFDWGGVLQRTASQTSRHALDHELGLAPGGVEAAVFDNPLWHQASIGQCSAARAWLGIADQLGIASHQVDDLIRRFFAEDKVDQHIVGLIRHLRCEGITVGLLSNAPPGYGPVDVTASRWGQEGIFQTQVFSYQVGALKPDPHTYQAILCALGAVAQETLFIDDAPANIAGALAIGMHAHLFVDTQSLLATLNAWGLPLDNTP